jgi:hypothetical protein
MLDRRSGHSKYEMSMYHLSWKSKYRWTRDAKTKNFVQFGYRPMDRIG